MPKKWLVLSFALTLLLSACAVSLASDITPPPNYKSPTPPPSSAQSVPVASQPLLPPDPVQGAAIYSEKCLPCHGAAGRGDGPQAAKLGLPVMAIGTTDLARKARPADWFSVVSNGRMERGMPPFTSLNDRQRWDVVAYVFTLSAPPSSVALGKQLYDEKCASCHGATGQGDGSEAATAGAKMPNWRDPGRLSQRSANDLVQAINIGVAPGMPAYASKYSEDQRWALVDYVRTLSFASNNGGQVAAAGTPAGPTPTGSANVTPVSMTPAPVTTVVPFKIAIGGKVTISGGASLPTGLKVKLDGYDSKMTPYWSATADVQPDGSYKISDVEVQSGRTFLATVDYQNVSFTSSPLHTTDLKEGQDADLPISLSDVTADTSGLSAQRMHVFFDFSTPGAVQVAELFIINNPGDKTVAPAAAGKPVVTFRLPDGAQGLSFQDGQLGDGRYVQTENGFGDATAIRARDTSQVLFGYQMMYTGKQSLSIPMTLPVESLVVMMPSNGVTLDSAQLRSMGERNVDGTNIKLFGASSLAAGSNLELTLSGNADSSPVSGSPSSIANNSEMIFGIGAFGVVLIVAGIWLYRQRRREPLEEEEPESPAEDDQVEDTSDALLDAIVALDDLYQSGELPESAYQQRRAQLKARLRALKSG